METIVVIVVISIALLTIFSSYNKILSKVRTENKYDTSEYLYMTEYIKKYLKEVDPTTIIVNKVSDSTINNFNVEKIYILKCLNGDDKNLCVNNKGFSGNETKFDAYMIDYIRKLDVRDKDELIIVEYKKEARIEGTYDLKKDTKDKQLYETYIASLEW